jgi:peptidoglycan/LPS O-acetylase OafA/YrhL
MVAMSHLGVLPGGYNIGVMAVMVFYLLAGMVADKLLSQPAFASPLVYWGNRLRRIGPLYLFSMGVAVAVWASGAGSSFLSRPPDLLDWLANLTVIPLAYYMYTGQDSFTLIPPAWSLGVELQFYLLAPFLLPRPKILQGLLWASFALFVCAVVGIVNTDYFGYRLLPGVLFVFLAGAMMNRALLRDASARRILLLLWLGIAVLFLWSLCFGRYLAYNYETLAALLCGLPLVYFFSSPLPLRIDRFLGTLSYGVFLLHFPALWLIERSGVDIQSFLVPAVLLLSLIFAAIGHIVAERRPSMLSSALFLNKCIQCGMYFKKKDLTKNKYH